MRFLKLIALFSVISLSPLFAFAQGVTTTGGQTATTTTGAQELADLLKKLQEPREKTVTPSIKEQQQPIIDAINNLPADLFPTATGIRTNAISEYLDIKTFPKNPGPNETVRVTAESYLSDLNKATMSWAINGKVIQRGTGMTSFSFKNGASGETTRLTISITTNTGEKVTRDFAWSPVGVTILWEADTYTPLFYKGKALLTPEARVRAIAIPDNTGTRNALSAGNLVYVWKKDGDNIPSASGYGKNSFSFIGPIPYGDTNVSVQVSSVNDSVKSEMYIDEIPLASPFILFYEKHPLLGTWYNRALGGDLALSKKEFSVSAEPYFFSNERSEAATIAYDWTLNSKAIANPGRTITLRNETGEDGDSELSLFMRGFKQTFQMASRDLRIHFTSGASARPAF